MNETSLDETCPAWPAVMVDIETLSTETRAAIVQVGAVAFDPSTWEVGATFFRRLDGIYGIRDDETVAWAAEHGTFPHPDGAEVVSEVDGLDDFARFVSAANPRGPQMWSWGWDFDRPILESGAGRAGVVLPWKFFLGNDARTVWKLAFGKTKRPEREHHALADCMAAIQDLKTAVEALKAGQWA